jgi:hypothetical protein
MSTSKRFFTLPGCHMSIRRSQNVFSEKKATIVQFKKCDCSG